MLSINTNLSSLIAQNSLKDSTNILNQAVERMTTGYKINHASDNAANYSIATNMTTKIGAYQVAEDNALQGLEMMSTSLESLNQISDKLNRMRALAVQSQNGTYGAQSLSAIKAEANALLDEITRINNSAEFNGIKLFNTGKMDVTNAGKELELNEQGFLQDVVKVDTTHMTKLSSVDPNATLAVGEYSISTVDELVKLQEMANAGLIETGSTFTLANDIDMSGVEWKGIGIQSLPFTGTFNGNGYAISNLKKSLFNISGSSTLKNIKLTNIISNNAGLCVNSSGTFITNCSVKGKITSTGYAGGISSWGYYSRIEYCYFEGDVVSTGSNVGGIVSDGCESGLSNCLVRGNVVGLNNVGGIAGAVNAHIRGSKVEANVTGNNNVGGITGMSKGSTDCYVSGEVKGASKVAGFVGSLESGSISNCILESSVSGVDLVGVFVGKQTASYSTSVKNSYYESSKVANLPMSGDIGIGSVDNANLIDITTPCDYTLQIGSCGDDERSTLSYTTYIDFGELNNVLSSGIENAGTIEKIDNLVNIVAMKQTELGTGINRLESVLEEISTQYNNLVSSRSTLRDADMAEVSSDYIRQQILQQASATLMATANQSPAIALQLI